MSTQTTRPADSEDGGTGERLPRLRRLLSPVVALSGVLLLVAAAGTAREDRRRAAAYGLAGGALLGVWLRREAGDGPTTPDPAASEDVSAEAAAHREQSKVLNQSETNPRGTSGEPDVERETDPEEGDVQFTTDQQEGGPKPGLSDEAGVEDPRRPDDGDDDHVEVDLSEAAMADEASEATGPTTEQAYPSREGTDPEPTSPEAPEKDGEGVATNPGPVPGEDEREDEETDEGAAAEAEDEDPDTT